MTPTRTLPFTPETRQASLAEAFGGPAAPSMPRERCSICSQIPKRVTRFVKGEEVSHDDIPEVARRIACVARSRNVGVEWISRCPECGRFYLEEQEYTYLVGTGSEDEKAYTPVDDPIAAFLGIFNVDTIVAGELRLEGGVWVLYDLRR